MKDSDTLGEVYRQLKIGKPVALATIIESRGSTPRGLGARMACWENCFIGTVGGGTVEHAVQQTLLELLRRCDKDLVIQQCSLTPEEVMGLGMVCGGEVTVLCQYLMSTEETQQVLEAAVRCAQQNCPSWLVTTYGTKRYQMAVVSAGGIVAASKDFSQQELGHLCKEKPMLESANRRHTFVQPIVSDGRCYIFGGGHVALETAKLLHWLDFPITVIDQRPEFANAQRFPFAKEVIAQPLEETAKSLSIGQKDWVLIMTRGHQGDYEVLRQVLKTPARYIGMVGSRQKVETTNARLREDGFGDVDIARVLSPVGIEIAAETPEEIAVSIAAQMIAKRNG